MNLPDRASIPSPDGRAPHIGEERQRRFPLPFFQVGIWITLLLNSGCQPAPDTPFTRLNNTGVDFRNNLTETDSFNIIEYLYYYNGAGVAAGDIDNDGLTDLFFTANEGPDQLFLNEGNFKFRNITEEAGVGTEGWSTGVTMADINGDGFLDIYVCQLGGGYKGKKGRNRMYINNGDRTFKESAREFGLDFSGFGTHAAFFDYDRDGDLDVYLLNHSVHSVENYGNAAIRNIRDPFAGDRLMRNDNGRFTDVSQSAGIFGSRIGFGLGLAIGDLNGDDWPDIYVSNDFHENDYLYLNNGDSTGTGPTFTEALEKTIGHTSQFSMGNAIADYNNDALPDILTLDMKPGNEVISKSSVGAEPYNIYQLKRSFGYYHQFPRNMLHLNLGADPGKKPAFAEIGQLAGIDATDWSWSALLEDMDNDGWKDLFIANGIWRRPNDLDYLRYSSNQQIQNSASDLELAAKMPDGLVPNYAGRNKGDLTFEEVSAAWGFEEAGVSNGAAFADLDNDGDRDLVINNLNAPASIYQNNATTGNQYLKIKLEGKKFNTSAIGAKVRLTIDGQVMLQELYTSKGYLSSTEPILLFGIGKAPAIDRLEVIWPMGEVTVLKNVRANQFLTIQQPDPGGRAQKEPLAAPAYLLSALENDRGLSFIHRENKFEDFDSERLIPHLLSTQGPRMAVADMNGDGTDDLYVCGALGQSGALYSQSGNGAFIQRVDFIADNAGSEETDAVFFDADQDGDPDLYLVNGGAEFPAQSPFLQDKLYVNDGEGNFKPAPLPIGFENGSCVVPLDFNRDGALDLFVGARSVPGAYGLDPRSTLLQNDGKGGFLDVTDVHLPGQGKLGMVTDACIQKQTNGWRLVVVGEWMPVKILTPGPGIWEENDLPGSHGWWNRVAAADLNGDGTDDLVLGNLGLNSALKASASQPVGLYVKDFDGNYTTDPILTYFKQGKEYTFVSTDELIGQLTGIKKQLSDYASFAALTFQDIFEPASLRDARVKKAERLTTSLALSDGKGGYQLTDLPLETQFSPVYAILIDDLDMDGNQDLLLAGNFYGARTAFGIYDASRGTLMTGDGAGRFKASKANQAGWQMNGEVRDLKRVKTPGGGLVVAGRNNAGLMVLEKGKPVKTER